ncbi:MAG: hypothetical protein WA902_18210 [Thermosynechococcaceae cyanobacterium]
MSAYRTPPPKRTPSAKQRIDVDAVRSLAIGFVSSAIILASPQLTFILSPLMILVHELGHAATAWLFGYPAIPSFDFIHGGGITLQAEQRFTPIVLVLYAAWGFGLYRLRQNIPLSQILLAAGIGYTLCLLTGLEHVLMIGMGHGFELGFACLFLYRTLSGVACRIAAERPLYGMLVCYILLYDLKFAHGLLFNRTTREIYQQGKGGILDHDFVRLANDYLGIGLSGVVILFMLACLTTPTFTILFYLNKRKTSCTSV